MAERVRAYAVAVASVAAAAALALALRPVIEHGAITLPFLAAVVVACWYGGLRPGLLAAILSLGLTEAFFFLPRLGLDATTAVRVVTFGVVALLTASLYGRARDAQARAEQLAGSREQLLRQEQAARADAETASRAKDEFLATLSHELRTPLNALVGWSWWLRRGDLDQSRRDRALEIIDRSAQSVAQLVEDLLDVSRIITGRLRLAVQRVQPAPAVLAALDGLRPAASAKSLELAVAVDETAGPVLADPDRLQQIAFNLLSNAIKFTPEKGRVDLTLRREDGDIVLTVRDTGKGIAPALVPQVFDRFRQAGHGRAAGLGLGLSIVRHLVEVHGGRVRVESAGEGFGATFTVTLPLAIDATAAAAAEPALAVDGPRLDGLRVLVVEDDADSRRWLQEILGQLGATVFVASSAREALDTFGREQPDVLVSDIRLPDADGYELIRRVRGTDGVAGLTPAVALTAYPRVEDRARALEAGFQMHVPKPVAPADLASVIVSVTRRGSEA
ncbi:MAG TPA: ATP-binding protein [Methylomirabilota bacterium]|nr:ATP-binding protein [Methylomirabilota bacterium]